MPSRILVVDDDRETCEMLRDRLERRDFEVEVRTSALEAFELLKAQPFDAVVSDVRMQELNGIDLCERIVANYPDVPVVVATGFGDLDTAIAAIRAGAHDFISKPFELEELCMRLVRAIQHRRLREQVRRLERRGPEDEAFPELIGESPALHRVRQMLGPVVESDAPVLITGESGTGKEIVARIVHDYGSRRDEPFVAINCAALPETLIESELFGHARGAFTDARGERRGLMTRAGKGTFFLDEIGDLPLSLQPKLLRVLQERSLRPVGGEEELRFEARVIAASNHDLETAVAEGRFREDLMFRIDVLRIEMPPLRTRGNDVLQLAQHFLNGCAARIGKPVIGISRAAAEKLLDYAWPGNARELQNCIERAVALTQNERLIVEDLPQRVRCYRRSQLLAGDDPTDLVPLDVVERRYIARVMEATGGNKTLAARILGLDRKTLYRKLDREDGGR